MALKYIYNSITHYYLSLLTSSSHSPVPMVAKCLVLLMKKNGRVRPYLDALMNGAISEKLSLQTCHGP